MKRKIGIIIALILAVAGVAALKSETVGATGRNGNIYCTFPNIGDDTRAQECAAILMHYHSKEGDLKKCPSDEEKCVKAIKSHIKGQFRSASDQNSATQAVLTKIKEYWPTIKDNLAICYESGAGQTACSNGSTGKYDVSYYKAGMTYYPFCYVEAKQNYSGCPKENTNSGGNNNDGGSGEDSGSEAHDNYGNDSTCSTSILPSSWCTEDANGIMQVIRFVISVLTGTVVVAGTIGIIICGVLWATARDNEQQIVKAKKRLFEIVIGMVAWILIALIGNLLLPQTSSTIEEDTRTSVNIEKGDDIL